MKSKGIIGLAVLMLIFSCVPFLQGQTAGTGALTGTITDSTGAVVPNVAVSAVSNDAELLANALAMADGAGRT